jgi:hypothetical protein
VRAPESDTEAVEYLLAHLDERGPREPWWYEVLNRASMRNHERERRFVKQRSRIVERFRRWLREHGKNCSVCGGHFKPRQSNQRRCRSCIQAGAR